MNKPYDPEMHHRKSIRLLDYDYHAAGAYYLTLCVQGKACLFGEISNGEVRPNPAGEMIMATWRELPEYYSDVETNALVVMPNHIHGVIVLTSGVNFSDQSDQLEQDSAKMSRMSLSEVVHGFKTLTATRYRQGVLQDGWQPYPGKLWQRNYYEHIIRDEDDLYRVLEYIDNNPARWHEDKHNPTAP